MPPRRFADVIKHPNWNKLTPDEQVEVREKWIGDMLDASGAPSNPEYLNHFTQQAYADIKPPPTEGAFFPPLREYPGRMFRQAVRAFTTPQQYLQSAFRQPADRPVTERITTPFKEAGEYFLGGEEKYPYTLYTDPMVIASLPGLLKSAVSILSRRFPTAIKAGQTVAKKGGEMAERIRPPGGLPWKEVPGEVPPLRTATVRPQPTMMREFISKTLPSKLKGTTLEKDTGKIAEFISGNPTDPLAQAITGEWPQAAKEYDVFLKGITDQLSQRGVITPSTIYKGMPTFEQASKRVRVKPPSSTKSPENIIEQVNNLDPTDPNSFMDLIKNDLGVK